MHMIHHEFEIQYKRFLNHHITDVDNPCAIHLKMGYSEQGTYLDLEIFGSEMSP